jgi:hypothetical protein
MDTEEMHGGNPNKEGLRKHGIKMARNSLVITIYELKVMGVYMDTDDLQMKLIENSKQTDKPTSAREENKIVTKWLLTK